MTGKRKPFSATMRPIDRHIGAIEGRVSAWKILNQPVWLAEYPEPTVADVAGEMVFALPDVAVEGGNVFRLEDTQGLISVDNAPYGEDRILILKRQDNRVGGFAFYTFHAAEEMGEGMIRPRPGSTPSHLVILC